MVAASAARVGDNEVPAADCDRLEIAVGVGVVAVAAARKERRCLDCHLFYVCSGNKTLSFALLNANIYSR